MMYMDLARMYEYKKTGVTKLDNDAEKKGIKGLTMPIVTEVKLMVVIILELLFMRCTNLYYQT